MPYWDWTQELTAPNLFSEVWKTFGGWDTRKFKDQSKLTTKAIDSYLAIDTFPEISRILHYEVTNQLIASIGGNVAIGGKAHFKPLYYSILRNVDRIWAIWQAKSEKNAIDYSGVFGFRALDDELKLGGLLDPRIKVTANDVMRIYSNGFKGLMCYTYAPPSTMAQRLWKAANTPI